MFTRRVLLALAPLLLLTASACTPTAPPAPDKLAGRTFLSTAVTHAGAPRPLVPATRIRLEFRADAVIYAAPGCNHLSGVYRLDGDRLGVGELASTDIGCPDERGAQDTWFAALLTDRPTWSLSGDTLTLRTGEDVVTLLDRRLADPNARLVGTAWSVDFVMSTTSPRPPGGWAPMPVGLWAAVGVAEDGSFAVNTSCGRFTGQATVTATALVITRVTGPRLPCPSAAAALNAVIYATLHGTVSYVVVARRMTLTAADGSGLSAGVARPRDPGPIRAKVVPSHVGHR
jgi:heat shock protein HslJ